MNNQSKIQELYKISNSQSVYQEGQFYQIKQDNLLKQIEETHQQMIKKQIENPNLIIPKNFNKFIQSKILTDLLFALYDYCTHMNQLEIRQKILDIEAQGRINPPPQLLSSESEIIQQKLIKISEIYCMIILKMGEYNVMYRDQNFFETLIYFVSQVLRKLFNREEFKLVEEELNRLFRTNTFNLIKKRHYDDERLTKFPVLKEQSGKETIEAIIHKQYQRSKIPKNNYKLQSLSEKSDLKPYYIKQTPCGSINSRSPIIAMLIPSSKERLFQFEQERKNRAQSFVFQSKLDQNDLSLLSIDKSKVELPQKKYLLLSKVQIQEQF